VGATQLILTFTLYLDIRNFLSGKRVVLALRSVRVQSSFEARIYGPMNGSLTSLLSLSQFRSTSGLRLAPPIGAMKGRQCTEYDKIYHSEKGLQAKMSRKTCFTNPSQPPFSKSFSSKSSNDSKRTSTSFRPCWSSRVSALGCSNTLSASIQLSGSA
jgi:hypothetical protein